MVMDFNHSSYSMPHLLYLNKKTVILTVEREHERVNVGK